MMKALLLPLAVIALVMNGGLVRAASVAPDELVRKLAVDMTAAVRSDPELQNPHSVQMSALVQKTVVPRFDFEKITQTAMGRNWVKANPTEKKQIVAEFTQLLIRTYSSAIANLKELDVSVTATRVNAPNADVTVRTQMLGRPQPVGIDYSLSNGSEGWKVYDVTVEGVSLVAAYRDEFTTLVSNGGVPGLVEALAKKNGK